MKFNVIAGIVLFLLAACATPPPAPAPDLSHVPPAIEGRIPTTYTKMQATELQRPEWINTVPAEADGMHYLVGMSQQHASERDAREEAMRDAREAFAKYTGVQVSAIDEMSRSLYGSASAVLDATVAGSSRSSEATDAQVSRIKAWKWYVETSRAAKANIDQGITHQAWVLVTVPASEYARVQEWKESRARAEKSRLDDLQNIAERERKELLEEHFRRLEGVERALAEGEIVRALAGLDGEYKRLGDLAAEREGNDGFFLQTAQALRRAQGNLVSRAEEIAADLNLEAGNLGSVCCLLPGDENKVSAWGLLKQKGAFVPACKLPVLLQMGTGGTAAKAVTDMAGRADFSRSDLPAGNYRLAVDVDGGALRGLADPFRLPLIKVENRLTVTHLQADLDGVTRGLVARLFAGPSTAPLVARRIVVGPVTYGESGQGGEFALMLKRLLSERLTQIPGLEVLSPRPRGVEDVAHAAETRGSTAGQRPALGAGATQAVIDGADAVLESVYTVRGGEVTINLALKAAGSDLLLAAASAGVGRETLPAGVGLMPRDGGAPPVGFGNGSIRLEITSHLGDGQTYADGDKISYFVRNDRDAYLLLIYEDAAHNLIRILPNRYSGKGVYRAGSTLQIPSRDDQFEFVITAPFGLERVWAFAASVPFPALPGEELENGLTLLRGNVNEVLAAVRGTSRREGVLYGEAQTTITTVSRASSPDHF